jgi:plasmid stability protein
MSVNLSIENVPDHVAEQLRRRAATHHRSVQGELLAILEQSVAEEGLLTPAGLLRRISASGPHTPAESARFIRADRIACAGR